MLSGDKATIADGVAVAESLTSADVLVSAQYYAAIGHLELGEYLPARAAVRSCLQLDVTHESALVVLRHYKSLVSKRMCS